MDGKEELKEAAFIARVKTSGNSLNVTIPVDTCAFCDLDDGDLVEFKILEIKRKKGK